jgi:hypothetical protein
MPGYKNKGCAMAFSLAALALTGNLLWSLRQFSCAIPDTADRSKLARKIKRSKRISDVKLKLKEKEG